MAAPNGDDIITPVGDNSGCVWGGDTGAACICIDEVVPSITGVMAAPLVPLPGGVVVVGACVVLIIADAPSTPYEAAPAAAVRSNRRR